jgi:hypothetical protein
LYSEYRLNDLAPVILDIESAWSPIERAIDAALEVKKSIQAGTWKQSTGPLKAERTTTTRYQSPRDRDILITVYEYVQYRRISIEASLEVALEEGC